MAIAAHILIALIALLHVYFVLLETVLFKTRGRRVFGLSAEKAEIMAPAMSNQGCYNGFLVAALAVALLHPDAAIARAFAVYGLVVRGNCRRLGRGNREENHSVHSDLACGAGADCAVFRLATPETRRPHLTPHPAPAYFSDIS